MKMCGRDLGHISPSSSRWASSMARSFSAHERAPCDRGGVVTGRASRLAGYGPLPRTRAEPGFEGELDLADRRPGRHLEGDAAEPGVTRRDVLRARELLATGHGGKGRIVALPGRVDHLRAVAWRVRVGGRAGVG